MPDLSTYGYFTGRMRIMLAYLGPRTRTIIALWLLASAGNRLMRASMKHFRRIFSRGQGYLRRHPLLPLRVRALLLAPVAMSTPRTAGLTACRCLITTPGQSPVSA